MQLIGKKEFEAPAFDSKDEIFIIYVTYFANFNNIYLFCRVQIASLKVNKTPITIFPEYSNLIDIFSPKLVVELLKHIGINNHAINIVNGNQPLYGLIYSLRLVKLEILKTYIKKNLVNNFIKPSKSLVDALILFTQKFNDSFCLYIDY